MQSNKLVNFGKNAATQLNGDVVVSNNNGSAPAAVVTTSQSGSEMPTIAGRVQTNAGDGSNTTSLGDFTVNTGATLNPSDPIQASADLASSQGSRLFLNTNPITQGASENQLAPAPVPYDSSASPLPSLENGASLKGSYYTSNLATGSSIVSIQESTKIFIQDGASSGPAVDIDTSILSNSGAGNVASKFQIYYSGSRPVNIDLNADFNGLIYAPNATVTLKRTKNLIGPRNFTGALVGNEVNLSTAGDTTVTILSNPATANNTLDDTPSAGSVSYLSKDGQPLLQGYKAVTWQEYNFVLVN
ncbi:MAG: hypothetical protein IPO31_00365 [Candidatus Obscuribacter sp.]|nr:hypothetical protein [Candidatus Obscuribacter sp.]